MRFVSGAVPALLVFLRALPAYAEPPSPEKLSAERFTYDIEWRLIHAGTAVIEAKPSETRIKLDSAGLVSALYKVDDTYSARYEGSNCAVASAMDSQEGKRHRETTIQFDRNRNRASYIMRDLLKNVVMQMQEIDIPPCTHDVWGAIQVLRGMQLAPGQSSQIPISDGRRAAQVKVDAQERETVKIAAGEFKTIRYEAGLFDGVVYMRKGRVLIWVTDDARRLPVQIKLHMAFPLGTVSLELAKEERP